MERPWEVTYGPEFEESKLLCKMSQSHLRLHLAALRVHLEGDPYKYSEAFVDGNHRAMDTADYFTDQGGRAMTAFVVIDPERRIAEVKWIQAGPLPSGDEEQLDEDDADLL